MKISGCLLAAIGLLGLAAAPAHAVTFNWNYTDGGSNTGSGTLEADQGAEGVFAITSIQGTANTESIIGGPEPSFAGTGLTVYWQPGAPPVFDPTNPFFFTDFAGFAFQVASTLYYAIYENTAQSLDPSFFPEYACGDATVPYCLLGPGPLGDGLGTTPIALSNFAVAPVPIPAALPFLATGLAALGFIGWRRKGKAQATTY